MFEGSYLMFGLGKTKTCPGCQGSIDEKSEDCITYNLKWLKPRHTSNKTYMMRRTAMTLLLHKKCLAEHIWKVPKYIPNIENFIDIEIEVNIKGEKLMFQVGPNDDGTDWILKGVIEGDWKADYRPVTYNKDLGDVLERMINKQDVRFAVFERDNMISPPVLLQHDDPLIQHVTSTSEYTELVKKAKEECEAEYNERFAIDPKNQILLVEPRVAFANKTVIKL